jgi:tRNA(Ile)-lysidine synthase
MECLIQSNMQTVLNFLSFQKIVQRLTQQKHFLVAFSGGLDSQVLLYLFSQWLSVDSSIRLRAIHIDHGLSPYALEWVNFSKKQCAKYHIPLVIQKIVIQKSSKQGIEAQARYLRYKAIQSCMENGEVLCTAHHQNDQAETTLLQWLRGAGPSGLAAMSEVQPFNQTQLLRPLLSFPRDVLQAFAQQHRLTWIEDESNDDLKFERNYVRKKIMPPLLASRRNCLNNLTRTAHHCAEAADLLEALADDDLMSIAHTKHALSIIDLLKLNTKRQRNVLRRWLTLAHIPMPTTAQLRVLQQEVIEAKADANPLLQLSEVTIRRYRSTLYIVPFMEDISIKKAFSWDISTVLDLPHELGTLRTKTVVKGGLFKKIALNKNLMVRFRQGGERMHPSKRSCATSLKRLFQEWQIPPWQRQRWPLIFLNDRLIAVANLDIDRNFSAKEGEFGFQIIWHLSNGEGIHR